MPLADVKVIPSLLPLGTFLLFPTQIAEKVPLPICPEVRTATHCNLCQVGVAIPFAAFTAMNWKEGPTFAARDAGAPSTVAPPVAVIVSAVIAVLDTIRRIVPSGTVPGN